MQSDTWNKIILGTTTIVLVSLWCCALTTNSHYKWDFFFLMFLLWTLFFIGAGDVDQWDTQKDMLNNLIGGIIGLGVFMMSSWVLPKRTEVPALNPCAVRRIFYLSK